MLYLGPFYYNYVSGVIIFAVIVSQYFLHYFMYNHGNIATDKPKTGDMSYAYYSIIQGFL